MITISAALEAAQRSSPQTPSIGVTIGDWDVGIPRLRWTRWYASTSEALGPCAAAVAGDGALLRARIDAGTGTLFVSRVASPTQSSTFSAWTNGGTVSVAPRLGLSAAGTRALLAAVSGGTTIEVRESTDGGATFGSPLTVATAGATVQAVSCALRADGGPYRILTPQQAADYAQPLPLHPLCGGLAPEVAWRYLRRAAAE